MAPDEKFAWYASFGLMVTLIWLYINILRLLSSQPAKSEQLSATSLYAYRRRLRRVDSHDACEPGQ